MSKYPDKVMSRGARSTLNIIVNVILEQIVCIYFLYISQDSKPIENCVDLDDSPVVFTKFTPRSFLGPLVKTVNMLRGHTIMPGTQMYKHSIRQELGISVSVHSNTPTRVRNICISALNSLTLFAPCCCQDHRYLPLLKPKPVEAIYHALRPTSSNNQLVFVFYAT